MTRSTPGYLGPYRLLNVVHTGHALRIWQAYDDGKQVMVGIKTPVERFQKDREQAGYLRWEYKVGRAVLYPRILEIFRFDFDRGVPYLAMEWFSAPNLKQRIQQGGEGLELLAEQIIERSAEALAYFNGRGWVHRDIKPDNFLVTDDAQVKLIDFALALRIRNPLFMLFTTRGAVKGTRSYMSPEQIRCKPLDQRADIYSFGCMVHELLSGKPPFTGVNTQELLNKHLKAAPPSLEACNPKVTAEFSDLVRRCLAKEPAGRPADMLSFLEELKTFRIFKAGPRRSQMADTTFR